MMPSTSSASEFLRDRVEHLDASFQPTEHLDEFILDRIRRKILLYARMGRYSAAEYWMDKLASLNTQQSVSDLYSMCEYLFLDGQFEACRRIIEKDAWQKKRSDFKYLLGRCYFTAGEMDEALKITAQDEQRRPESRKRISSIRQRSLDEVLKGPGSFPRMTTGIEDDSESKEYLAAIEMLRGKIFDKLENPQNAAECYQRALDIDPFSIDALELLSSRKALTADQLNLNGTESVPHQKDFLLAVYKSQISTSDSESNEQISLELANSFASNPDFILSEADKALQKRDFVSCLEFTERILEAKPFYRRALPVHIAALVHLGRSSQLFELSHRLVTLYPNEIFSWYATASYYFVCGHMEMTRRYLAKAIAIDKTCGYIWLLYGHSFSKEKEHDQAMAAYFRAVDVMKGSGYPYLYVAREYARTNNFVLAEKFYEEARNLSSNDPLVLHELGLLLIKKAESVKNPPSAVEARNSLTAARDHFVHALGLLKVETTSQRMMDQAAEEMYESLGAVHIKLKEPSEAIRFARLALQIHSSNSIALKLIGMANVMLGNINPAVDALQRALAVSKDDQSTKKMLTDALELCSTQDNLVDMQLPPVDLTAKPKVKLVKGPAEPLRSPVKRAANKKTAVKQTSTESSAMELSIGNASASFVGEFRAPSGSVENVSMRFYHDV